MDDLVRYFDGSVAPTGVGRVQLEIIPHLVRLLGDRIGLVRIGQSSDRLRLLSAGQFARLVDTSRSPVRRVKAEPALSLLRFGRWSRRRLADNFGAAFARSDMDRFAAMAKPGDLLLSLGGSWSNPAFAANAARLKQRFGLRFGLLIHDILPLSHPDLVAPAQIPGFRSWFTDVAPLVDIAMSPSKATAVAAEAWASQEGLSLPPVSVIPFGDGFGEPPRMQPARRDCVVYVSTVEVRKNHMLLFRIWRRLLERHPREAVPDLVFAGKFGWMVDDLRKELAATGNLGGKIVTARNLTDGELSALYRRSLFTVFPSLAEGWGLPIAESLRHGRFCIASNATSIPEVGGDFVDYHAPHDEEAAFAMIERAIFDGEYLAARESRIATSFVPRAWADTARAIVDLAGMRL